MTTNLPYLCSMLRRLTLHNFKSWPELDIKFRPITVLFGANSSGKSSIIQFLMLLKQTKDSTNNQAILEFGDISTPVELGSYRDTIFRHDPTLKLDWKLKWTAEKPISINDIFQKKSKIISTDKIAISVDLSARGKQVVTNKIAYHTDGIEFSLSKREGKPGYQLISSDEARFRFVRSLGRAWDLPEPTKCFSLPDQAQTYFQNAQFLGQLENSYVTEIDSILHLGPLRDDPKRQYSWSGSTPADVGPRGERTVEAILSATDNNVRRNLKYKSPTKSFQEMIAWWLKKLGLISGFRVAEVGRDSGLFRVFVQKSPDSVETLITDVGFGVSQILPMLTLLYFAEEGSTILIEQPEIHLHPHVQSGLADLVIATAKNRKLQLIIESHSEHFLNRLLRRVAEKETEFGDLEANDVGLYFCENVKGQSVLTPLQLNLFGGVENWPRDFFGDQIGDIIAREKAAAQRRIASAGNAQRN
jgi:predicted ATPase